MIEKQARVTGDHGSSELKRKGIEKFISQKVFASCYLANSDGRPRLLTSLNERSFLSVKPDTESHPMIFPRALEALADIKRGGIAIFAGEVENDSVKKIQIPNQCHLLDLENTDDSRDEF